MTQTILITGGAGFIGSNLAHHLSQTGDYRIVISDRFNDGAKWRNLIHVPVEEIIDPANLFYWLEVYGHTLETVVHLGGVSDTTERNVGQIVESNHQFPVMLWRWCVEQEKRFIFASSAEIYGAGEQGFNDTLDVEYLRKLRPLNPNGWSKKLFDTHVALAFSRGDKMPKQWAGLRFFNLYGANEYHKGEQRSVLLQLYEEAAKGIPVRLFKSANPEYPDGSQQRDFVYVQDCVKVLAWLLASPDVNGLYNCGTGKARSFAELAQALFSALGKPPNIKYVDMPSNIEHQYQYRTEAVIDRLREAGYTEPFTSLEDGVNDYIQQHLSNHNPYLG